MTETSPCETWENPRLREALVVGILLLLTAALSLAVLSTGDVEGTEADERNGDTPARTIGDAERKGFSEPVDGTPNVGGLGTLVGLVGAAGIGLSALDRPER